MVDNFLCNVILNKEKKFVNFWNIFIFVWKYKIRNRLILMVVCCRNVYFFLFLYNVMFKYIMYVCFGGLILLI